jgi:hypothetical protein
VPWPWPGMRVIRQGVTSWRSELAINWCRA